MFNFTTPRRPRGLFAGDIANRLPVISPAVLGGDAPRLGGRRRGLFGQMGDWLNADPDNDGVRRRDGLAAIVASLHSDPSFGHAALARNRATRQQSMERQREEQARAEELAAAEAGRQQRAAQINAALDAAGVTDPAMRARAQFDPEGVFEQLTRPAEPPDLPSSFEEFQLAQQHPDYGAFLSRNPRGNNVTVNTGQPADMRPQIGSIPQGFQARFDQDQGSYVFEPIPGGPVDRADEGMQEFFEQSAAVVNNSIANVEDIILNPDNDFVLGRAGQALALVNPQSAAGDLVGYINAVRANVGFDRVQAMRRTSPTGGAVGQLSDPERRALEATQGDLSNARSPRAFLVALGQVRNAYLDGVYGSPEKIAEAIDEGRLTESARQYAQRLDPNAYADSILARRAQAETGAGLTPAAPPAASPSNESAGYPEGTVIENDRGQRRVLRNGRWEPM